MPNRPHPKGQPEGRQPLVNIRRNSNSYAGTDTRKSLPTKKFGSRDMDRDSPTGPTFEVPLSNLPYLDSDDNRGK